MILRQCLSFLFSFSYDSTVEFSRDFMTCDDIISLMANGIYAAPFQLVFSRFSKTSSLGFSMLLSIGDLETKKFENQCSKLYCMVQNAHSTSRDTFHLTQIIL